ncbi:MAG: hypothetical protein J0M18_02940 [Ignavibacteria bacterium]|jgi:hypothetical protein|nr:hypothetical protein [Ignavibacteria bacterium]
MKKLVNLIFVLFIFSNVLASDTHKNFVEVEKSGKYYSYTPQENIGRDATNAPCPKYKTFQKVVITSSISGQISDTGWLETSTQTTCDPVVTGEQPATCQTQFFPGSSLGVGDETISTCTSVKTECVQDCAPPPQCTASSATNTIQIQFPKIEFIKEKLAAVAQTTGFIKKFELYVAGAIARKTGEECCLADQNQPPVSYTEYSGSVTGQLDVKLAIPGWSWSLQSEWQGIYKVKAEISLGPTVTVSPSATIGITGKTYDANKCPTCVSVGVGVSVGLDVNFEGNLECRVMAFEGSWFEINAAFQLLAQLGLKSSIGVTGTYNWDGCPQPGFSGKFSYGALTGYGKASVTIWGTEVSFTREVTLLEGGNIPF